MKAEKTLTKPSIIGHQQTQRLALLLDKTFSRSYNLDEDVYHYSATCTMHYDHINPFLIGGVFIDIDIIGRFCFYLHKYISETLSSPDLVGFICPKRFSFLRIQQDVNAFKNYMSKALNKMKNCRLIFAPYHQGYVHLLWPYLTVLMVLLHTINNYVHLICCSTHFFLMVMRIVDKKLMVYQLDSMPFSEFKMMPELTV